MGACHHNNYNNDEGSSIDPNHDFAAGRGTADFRAGRPSDGFPHLHRLTAGSARGCRCETGRNRADFYKRNR